MLQENREYVLMSDPSVTVTVKPESPYEGGPAIWSMVSGPEWLSSARWAYNGYAIGSDISFAAKPCDLIEKDRLTQFEIPVRDVLALLKEGKTDFFTCYNVAVCMIPYFESHHYEKWARHKEWSMETTMRDCGDDRLITSGYYAFNFIMNHFVLGTFEYCIINDIGEDNYRNFIRELQVNPSSPYKGGNFTDEQLMTEIKSRYIQSPSEVREWVRDMLDKQEQISDEAKAKLEEMKSSEPEPIESAVSVESKAE